MKNPRMACVDIETTGLDWSARILTVAVSWRDEGGQVCSKGWSVGMSDLFTSRDPLPLVRHELGQILAKVDLIGGHNMAFDLSYLYRDQLLDSSQVQNKLVDTLILARMTGPYDSVSLQNVSLKFGLKGESWDRMKKLRGSLEKLSPESVLQYNKEDTHINLLLAEKMWAQAIVIYPPEFITQECGFSDLMARIRLRGQTVDRGKLSILVDEYQEKKKRLIETYLHPHGIEGPSHHDGLIKYLIKEGQTFVNYTPGGKPSVNEDSLNLMVSSVPEHVEVIIKAVLDAREAEKRLSTWLVPILENHSVRDGRVHANFTAGGAFTYRLTANEPGVQAMPKELDFWGPYWSCDYKQAEPRLGAMYAKDNALARIFATGEDLYIGAAREMFSISPNDLVDKATRKLAKQSILATIYYSGPATLAMQCHVTLDVAKKTIDANRRVFKPLRLAAEQAMDVWEKRGYLTLLCGKRIYLPDNERGRTYKAFNNLIQGGVAGIVGKAMRELDKRGYWLVGQTHDEIRFDPDYPTFDQDEVREVMRGCVPEVIQGRTNPMIDMDVDVELVGAKELVTV